MKTICLIISIVALSVMVVARWFEKVSKRNDNECMERFCSGAAITMFLIIVISAGIQLKA